MIRWFAKRFLHPDIISDYAYVFLWDEDLGVEDFNGKRYKFESRAWLYFRENNFFGKAFTV